MIKYYMIANFALNFTNKPHKMKTKNFGPCSIINCVDTNVRFRVITELAYEKCLKNQTKYYKVL